MTKKYMCTGYSFGRENEHLLGCVGDVHTLDEWKHIAFPKASESVIKNFFNGYNDKEICEYLHRYMKIRLEKVN